MNLRQLQAFKAVMHEGTVTQAAHLMGVTQPAISSMIANLEQDVGFALFRRHKGRVHPTPEALHLFDEVEKALSGMDKVLRAARDIKDLSVGQLQVASLPGPSLVFLPRVVAEFIEARPGVTVSLQTRSSLQIKEWIAAQLYDIGLAELPVDDPAIEVEALSFNCVCVMPAGHALAREEVITPHHLSGLPIIALSRDHMTHFRLRDAFLAAGVPWSPRCECQLFAPACSLVAGGAGIAVVEPITAANYADRGLVSRPFEPRIPFDIGLLYPAMRPRSNLAREFTVLLRERFSPYLSTKG
jgi:DNA-binding transcriptional LysR family regulator